MKLHHLTPDRTLSGASTPDQSGPGSDGIEGVVHIPQISNITAASSSDVLVSYPEYSSAEMQSVYSTAPTDCAHTYDNHVLHHIILYIICIFYNIYIYIHTYVYTIKVKLATLVEGNQNAPFSIATTLICRRGHNSFPWIAPLYPWYVPYIAEC